MNDVISNKDLLRIILSSIETAELFILAYVSRQWKHIVSLIMTSRVKEIECVRSYPRYADLNAWVGIYRDPDYRAVVEVGPGSWQSNWVYTARITHLFYSIGNIPVMIFMIGGMNYQLSIYTASPGNLPLRHGHFKVSNDEFNRMMGLTIDNIQIDDQFANHSEIIATYGPGIFKHTKHLQCSGSDTNLYWTSGRVQCDDTDGGRIRYIYANYIMPYLATLGVSVKRFMVGL